MYTDLPRKIVFGTYHGLQHYLQAMVSVDDGDYSLDELGNDLVTTIATSIIFPNGDLAVRPNLVANAARHFRSGMANYNQIEHALTPLITEVTSNMRHLVTAMPQAWQTPTSAGDFRYAYGQWWDCDLVLHLVR